MVTEPTLAEGHEHAEECAALYGEWLRYHAAVVDTSGRFSRGQVLEAMRERDMFERQLRALGCSGEARRRAERAAEIAAHGHPVLTHRPVAQRSDPSGDDATDDGDRTGHDAERPRVDA